MAKKAHVFFHRTTSKNAAAILTEGFRDAVDDFGVENGDEWEGVWLSVVPLHNDEGTRVYIDGNALLRVIFAGTMNLNEYEIVQEGKPYREWMMPAELLNNYAVVRLVKDEV